MLTINSLLINQLLFLLLLTLSFFNGIEFFGIELYLYLSILISLINIDKIIKLDIKILLLPLVFILLIYLKQFLDIFFIPQIDNNALSYLIRSIFFLIFFILGVIFYREVILKSNKNFFYLYLFLILFISLFFYISFIIEPSSQLLKKYEIVKGLNENLYILTIFFLIGIILKNCILYTDTKIYFLFFLFLLLLFLVNARSLFAINALFILGYFFLNNNFLRKIYSKKYIFLLFIFFSLTYIFYIINFHEKSMSDTIRYTLLITGFNEFANNLYGVGIDQIKYINQTELFRVLPHLSKKWASNYYPNSHNTYSQIFSEFGLIGVALIIVFFATTYKMITEFRNYYLITPIVLYFNFSLNIFLF